MSVMVGRSGLVRNAPSATPRQPAITTGGRRAVSHRRPEQQVGGAAGDVVAEYHQVGDLAGTARPFETLLPRAVRGPEVHGLLALCELTAARFPARTGPDGSPILLEDQDRHRWDLSAIGRGLAALACPGRRPPDRVSLLDGSKPGRNRCHLLTRSRWPGDASSRQGDA
jgi:hypothetical protein